VTVVPTALKAHERVGGHAATRQSVLTRSKVTSYTRRIVDPLRLKFLSRGGFHLFNATDEQLTWTAGKLKEAGLAYLLGGHCTGIEAVYRIRAGVGLTRKNAVVSAVGSSFTLGKGIAALSIAS
jgi:7,8-dihydropterin-6-yl-methyl-4-(beta-D-ribofuranosyl)aminobenzene 5'-phosphate synthase